MLYCTDHRLRETIESTESFGGLITQLVPIEVGICTVPGAPAAEAEGRSIGNRVKVPGDPVTVKAPPAPQPGNLPGTGKNREPPRKAGCPLFVLRARTAPACPDAVFHWQEGA